MSAWELWIYTQASLQALPGVSWGSHVVGGDLASRRSGEAASVRAKPCSPTPSLTLSTPGLPEVAILISVLPPRDGFHSTEEPGVGHQVALSGTDAGSRSAGMLGLYLTFASSAQLARQMWRQPGDGFRPARLCSGHSPLDIGVGHWVPY